MTLAEAFEVREHPAFEIRAGDSHDRHVIQPHGALDLATAGQLHAALTAALERSTQTIVLDLRRHHATPARFVGQRTAPSCTHWLGETDRHGGLRRSWSRANGPARRSRGAEASLDRRGRGGPLQGECQPRVRSAAR